MNDGVGTQFDKTELERLMQEQGVDPGQKNQEEPTKTRFSWGTVILFLLTAVYFALLFFGKSFLPEDVLNSMNAFSGVENPNRVIRAASLAILTLSGSTVLRFVIVRIAMNKALTKRTGMALMDMLSNFIKYLAFLVMVFLILSALGANTVELLAGLGILSLILGLGVTSLIEDVVAGVFIVGERLFDVGDIVVVDDFRGKILSIGIRSTQIEDDGGDILILRNSSIESLINMTNRSSYAVCDIPISPSESYAHVEEVIKNAHLEDLKQRYPEIEKGPFFLGLSEITDSGAQIITFVAICPENTKYWIQRILNRELKLLFESNDIQLGESSEE